MNIKRGDKVKVIKKCYYTIDPGYIGICQYVGETSKGEEYVDLYFKKK